MGEKRHSQTALFLMEMIMVVGFFMICAAICLQVFTKANSLSTLAEDTNHAVVAAENMAEGWKAKTTTEGMEECCFWTAEWEEIPGKENAAFAGELKWSTDQNLERGIVTILRIRDGKVLFQIPIARRLNGKQKG